MKKIIFLFFILMAFKGYSQVYQLMPQYGYQIPRADIQLVLKIPSDTTNNKTGIARIGTVLYSGNGTYWTAASGGGGGGGTDSSIVAGFGLTKNIASNVINLKVDTSVISTPYDLSLKQDILTNGSGTTIGSSMVNLGGNLNSSFTVNGNGTYDARFKSYNTGFATQIFTGETLLGDIDGVSNGNILSVSDQTDRITYTNGFNTAKFGLNTTTVDSTLSVEGSIKVTGGARFIGTPQTSLDTTTNKIAVFASDGTLKKSYWQSVGSGLIYPNTTNKYLNGYGNFPTLHADSITNGTTNKFTQWATTGSDIGFSGGSVGIGTISPVVGLHVESSSLFRRGTGTFTQLDIDVPGTTYSTGNGFSLIGLGTGYSGSGIFTNASAVLVANSGTEMANGMAIGAINATGTLRMYTGGNNERMRIAANGDVSIAGLTTNGYVKTSGGTGLLSVSSTIPTTDLSGTITNAQLAGGIDLTTKVTGVLPVANGGTGTATPALVAGTNVTITGTWPNQTINASGGGGGGLNYSQVKSISNK